MTITVSRTIDAPAKDLFSLLTLPARHPDFDASGMVRSAENTERIEKVGEKFVMNMQAKQHVDYRMHNHVTAFDENAMLGWKPATDHDPDILCGWEWLYELKPVDADTTEVSLTYSWSDVSDPQLQAVVPAFDAQQLEESLNLLAAAVTQP